MKKKMPEISPEEYEKLLRDLPKLPGQDQLPQLPDDDSYFDFWNPTGKKFTGKYKVSSSLPEKMP